jgi:Ca2+-binding EF-hand superfamily protein
MRALRKQVGKKDDKKISYEDLEAFMMEGEELQQPPPQRQEQGEAHANPNSAHRSGGSSRTRESSRGDGTSSASAASITLERCEQLVCAEMQTTSAAMLPLAELKNYVFDNDVSVDYAAFAHEKQCLVHAIGVYLSTPQKRRSNRSGGGSGGNDGMPIPGEQGGTQSSSLAPLESLQGAPSLNHSPKAAGVAAAMSSFDGDEDGDLSHDAKKRKKRMRRRTSQLRDAIRTGKVDVVFKQADFKNKGYLRKDGFKAMVQTLGVQATEDEIKRMFKHIDKDKDKKILIEDISSFVQEAYF